MDDAVTPSVFYSQKIPSHKAIFRNGSVVSQSTPSPSVKRKATCRAKLDINNKKKKTDNSSISSQDSENMSEGGSGAGSDNDSSLLSDLDASNLSTESERGGRPKDKDRLIAKGSRRSRDHAPSVSESNRLKDPQSQDSSSNSAILPAPIPPSLSQAEANEPITKAFLTECFDRFDSRLGKHEKKVNDKIKKIAKHTVKNTKDISKVKEKVTKVDEELPKINERIDKLESSLPSTFDDRIKKVMAEQRSNAFRERMAVEINEHRKKLIFFNVKIENEEEAKGWVKSTLEGLKHITEVQLKGIQNANYFALPKSQDNRHNHTTHVQVTFSNEGLKVTAFSNVIKDGIMKNRQDKLTLSLRLTERKLNILIKN